MRHLTARYLLIAVMASGSPGAVAAPSHVELSQVEARRLITMVVKHDGYDMRKRGMGLDLLAAPQGNILDRGYFEFSLTYDTPSAGATAALRLYAISRRTGDVWEINLCQRYDFPALQAAQRRLQHETGYRLADEKPLGQALGCVGDARTVERPG